MSQSQSPTDIIEGLEKVVLQDSRKFACGGTIDRSLIDPSTLALHYSKNGQDSTMLRFPPTPEALAKMLEDASESPFGKGQEKVYDETYRRAKEFKPPHMALSSDLVYPANILDVIANHLVIDKPIKATLNKVNAYPTGGFFKPHRDTPLGQQHLGTITICLPTAFTGGELVVKQDGHQITFDWGKAGKASDAGADAGADADADADTDAAPATDDDLIRWAFLYADCEHEVLPVLSGTRITVAYDVWYYTKPSLTEGVTLRPQDSRTYAALSALLADKERFMPLGGTLAFGARHAYPRVNPKTIGQRLKGVDQQVKLVTQALGLDIEYRAAYSMEGWEFDDPEEAEQRWRYAAKDGAWARGSTPGAVDVHSVGSRYSIVTGLDFNQIDGHYGENNVMRTIRGIYDYYRPVSREENPNEGGWNADVIWVTEVGAYGHASHYTAYGNQPEAATTYVGVAMFVTIPPGSER